MKRNHLFSTLLSAAVLATAVLPTGTVLAADLVGPATSGVSASPNPATVGTLVSISATVDDSATGGSLIQGAEYSLNSGAWTAMTAADGAFDSIAEGVAADVTVTQAGSNSICVRGTDAAGSIGDPACADFVGQYLYTFSGFKSPIRMGAENKSNAPRTIPVKWKLTLTADSAPVSAPSSFVGLYSYQVDCTTLAGDAATATLEPTAGKSGLRYLGGGKWIFNWKTPKTYRGTCRTMYALFSDGQMSPSVVFRFR